MARALGLSFGAVSKYLRAVRAAGIGPTEAEALPESQLERRVFGPAPPAKPPKLVLCGVITLELLLVGLSLLLELADRDHWVSMVITGVVITFLLVGSIAKLWRALRYGDLSVTSQVLWLP